MTRKSLVMLREETRAKAFAGDEGLAQIAETLAYKLGRPAVARLTGIDDVNVVTRWSMGRIVPDENQCERMRHAMWAFELLVALGESDESASQWFRGDNPTLQKMPMDAIAGDEGSVVIDAILGHASQTY